MDVIQEIIVYFISGRKSGIDITQIFPEEGTVSYGCSCEKVIYEIIQCMYCRLSTTRLFCRIHTRSMTLSITIYLNLSLSL